MRWQTYNGSRRNEISFPLGGIGTGCIGLGGDGRFREWEIFNRPAKGQLNGYSHIAIKAEKEGRVVDARVMHTDLKAPFTGEPTLDRFRGFGFGPYRETLSGIPHFADGTFRAAFPLAELAFHDDLFPGQVCLKAFNPLIPLREDDSSLPAAFFEIEVLNSTDAPLDYTVAFSLSSPFPSEKGEILAGEGGAGAYLLMRPVDGNREALDYGEICVATDQRDTARQRYWYRGEWFDDLSIFWQDFSSPGPLRDRVYSPAAAKRKDTGTLAAKISLAPGRRQSVRFLVAWYFPNVNYYPDPQRTALDGTSQWKNYYATLYPDALAVARDGMARWDALYRDTFAFAQAFYDQSLPEVFLEAAGSNLSTLKSPTVWRLEDGSFYGWEGVHTTAGSCEGSCTHVWNYAYALPFLFPRLERSMREMDYRYNQDAHGGMHFRLQLPLGAPQSSFRPCCDGQFGGVIKTYRDWKICGDDQWLRRLWPAVKKSLAYAWSPDNPDAWDRDRDGVLEGRQHHTLDMELFGPNSWMTSMYLAALKAGAEMAEYLGEENTTREYRELMEKGARYADEKLFNGEYYQQTIDLKDQSLLLRFVHSGKSLQNEGVIQAYWNAEGQEIKYQIGEGSIIDQVLGQWHAALCGLGGILDPEHVKSALRSIHRFNFIRDMRLYVNPCRLYAMPDEQGTAICVWPKGKKAPLIGVPYAQEMMTGFEYQAASHMILADMPDAGEELVRAVRNRFDGERRNPWNEFECGSNYARAMASYALVLAVSGFRFDLSSGMLGFVPHDPREKRNYFWSVNSAWGIYLQDGTARQLRVLAGELTLKRFVSDQPICRVRLGEKEISLRCPGTAVDFGEEVHLTAGTTLEIE